jgi:hypothetical protein
MAQRTQSSGTQQEWLERRHCRKKPSHKKEDETKCSPWKKKRQYTCRLFWANSLNEGAM